MQNVWLFVLLVDVLPFASGQIADESCGLRLSANLCRATQDYVIVADNSWSVEDSFDTISEIMLQFVSSFDLDANDTESPRIGCSAPSSCHRTPGERERAFAPRSQQLQSP